MLDQATSRDIHNAISSPGSAFGRTPCVPPDGPTLALFGQALAPANLSARQAREMGLLTSGTCGPHGSTSLASANLALSLGSKLSGEYPKAGSTLFTMTWKRAATPSGRSVFRLVASGRNTAATGFGSWPTPTKTQAGGSPEQFLERKRRSFGAKSPKITDLALAVRYFYAEMMGYSAKSLNPAFPCWLMGLPPSWHKTAPMETRSTRRQPKP